MIDTSGETEKAWKRHKPWGKPETSLLWMEDKARADPKGVHNTNLSQLVFPPIHKDDQRRNYRWRDNCKTDPQLGGMQGHWRPGTPGGSVMACERAARIVSCPDSRWHWGPTHLVWNTAVSDPKNRSGVGRLGQKGPEEEGPNWGVYLDKASSIHRLGQRCQARKWVGRGSQPEIVLKMYMGYLDIH